jgi:type I restriction enzyme M protein
VAKANNNENLNTDLATIFSAIESSANGYPDKFRDVLRGKKFAP